MAEESRTAKRVRTLATLAALDTKRSSDDDAVPHRRHTQKRLPLCVLWRRPRPLDRGEDAHHLYVPVDVLLWLADEEQCLLKLKRRAGWCVKLDLEDTDIDATLDAGTRTLRLGLAAAGRRGAYVMTRGPEEERLLRAVLAGLQHEYDRWNDQDTDDEANSADAWEVDDWDWAPPTRSPAHSDDEDEDEDNEESVDSVE